MEQARKISRIICWRGTPGRHFVRMDTPDWWDDSLSMIAAQKLRPCLQLRNASNRHSVVVFRIPGDRGFVIHTGRRSLFPSRYPVLCPTSGDVIDFITITSADWQVLA